MSSQSPTFKVLLTGLRTNAPIPDYFRTLYGTPDEIKAKVAADAQRLKEAGHDVSEFFLDENKLDEGLEWLTTKLRAEQFDGIMVGSGLRLIPEMTAIYELVVNVVATEGKGSVLLFNDGPGGNWDAVQRNRKQLEERKKRKD